MGYCVLKTILCQLKIINLRHFYVSSLIQVRKFLYKLNIFNYRVPEVIYMPYVLLDIIKTVGILYSSENIT
jgi:hypothetical protein